MTTTVQIPDQFTVDMINGQRVVLVPLSQILESDEFARVAKRDSFNRPAAFRALMARANRFAALVCTTPFGEQRRSMRLSWASNALGRKVQLTSFNQLTDLEVQALLRLLDAVEVNRGLE